MFQVGVGEFVVLAIVAVIVLGPDRIPQLTRDAARMLRTLRELATGARTQLRDELGPEFADLNLDELRNLNPRTALSRAILGDPEDGIRADLRKLDPREDFRAADPRQHVRDAMNGFRDDSGASGDSTVSMDKPTAAPQRPLGRGESAPYDEDAT